MLVKSAKFLISSTDVSKCPPPSMPEYAFIGRSNVGKSSLINLLTSKKELAHTSSKPGKTQLINHFVINDSWYLVDLPGYGFAALSKTKKEEFGAFVRNYILQRPNLMCLFLLIDSRLPLQPIDNRFMTWLAEHEVPFTLVFTKADKLSKTQLANNLEAYKKSLLEQWEELPTSFVTSAAKGLGEEELIDYILASNKLFKPIR